MTQDKHPQDLMPSTLELDINPVNQIAVEVQPTVLYFTVRRLFPSYKVFISSFE